MGNSSNIQTLSSILVDYVNDRLKEVHTVLPGEIVEFDPVTQLAKVQPTIQRVFIEEIDGEEVLVPKNLPVLINVPTVFPRGGGFSMTFPVSPGDECMVLFCERSLDTWHKFGGVRNPNIKRFHSLSDGICVVGLSSTPNKITDYDSENVVLRSDDNSTHVKLKTDGDIDFKATNVNVDGNLKVSNNLEVDGDSTLQDVTSNGKNVGDTHTHSGVTSGPSNTGPVV